MLRACMRITRTFSFRPSQPLEFENGKYCVLKNTEFGQVARGLTSATIAASLYIGSRIVRFYSELGWFSFSFHSVLFLGLGIVGVQNLAVNRTVVESISLLRDGQRIEVTAGSRLGMRAYYTLNIKDIVDSKEHQAGRFLMGLYESWILMTHQHMFAIPRIADVLDKEVLQAILNGETVVTGDEIQDQDIIDI